MRIENSFEVARPTAEVWSVLLDVPAVVPCMPGAELLEVVDDRTWKGRVTVRLGPVSLAYAGTVVLEELDETAHRAELMATGTETRGKGMARARVVSSLKGTAEGGTRVVIVTDLSLSGAVAQMGRGMIADVSARLTDQFARCLKARLVDGSTGGTASPVGGVRLGLWALVRAIRRALARLWAIMSRPFR
jgi:carbon monoxide dehydrogenase subunit G